MSESRAFAGYDQAEPETNTNCLMMLVEEVCEKAEEDTNNDGDSLIPFLGREISIICLAHWSRSVYSTLMLVNKSFNSIIRSDEIYRLRRKVGIAEHWVYLCSNLELQWMAYDSNGDRWMTLPEMPADIRTNILFKQLDRESLAVGTELLVFGKEFDYKTYVTRSPVMRYNMVTNSWSRGTMMNSPRCLFGSASLGAKGIVAGGVDEEYNPTSIAELYDSEKQTWVSLPNMNTPRRKCSGVFMDGKFYAIGGTSTIEGEVQLTCAEEYDLDRGSWRVIPNMAVGLCRTDGSNGAPPLVAVVDNQLYAANYEHQELWKYNKENNTWTTLGRLPERSVTVNGWGIAFGGCGDRLIVIGEPMNSCGSKFVINSWIPKDGPVAWKVIIPEKTSGSSFILNCAVMGC